MIRRTFRVRDFPDFLSGISLQDFSPGFLSRISLRDFSPGFLSGISLQDFSPGFLSGISLRDFSPGFLSGISLRGLLWTLRSAVRSDQFAFFASRMALRIRSNGSMKSNSMTSSSRTFLRAGMSSVSSLRAERICFRFQRI